MAFVHPTGLSAGSDYAALSPLPGYELWSDGADAVAAGAPVKVRAWTNTNVKETNTPGSYTVIGGITLDTGFVGRISWRLTAVSANTLADEWVSVNEQVGGVGAPPLGCE